MLAMYLKYHKAELTPTIPVTLTAISPVKMSIGHKSLTNLCSEMIFLQGKPVFYIFLPSTPPYQGFQSGQVPGTFTRLRLCIVPTEITESSKISGGSKPQVRWSIGLWNIFHKKLMITSIAEFSHSNRTTASRPS